MSVTISGNGTITGLSAGGLPDGTVTAADLASTLDLTGKTVTLPAGVGGKILQVVQTITKTAYSSTSSSWTPMCDNCLITPTSASSKFVILFTGMMSVPAGADNFVNILRTVGGVTTPVENYGASRGMFTAEGIFNWIPIILTVLDSPATTSQINYRVGAKSTNGDTIDSLNYGTNGGMFLSTVVMEVA
jgi:hypothetical protein